MKLQSLYNELLLKIGFNQNIIKDLWLDLEQSYSGKLRHYHNLNHLEEMVNLYKEYYNELQFPNEVLYSIFYHDYIYKVARKDNELKSAEHAIKILPELATINKKLVFDMICATQHHRHSENEDSNWLIDFDLKVLANDWNDYVIYYNQIRKEYKIYPNLLYNPGRKKALKHFLENESIFQTESFKSCFEKSARANIEREISLLT